MTSKAPTAMPAIAPDDKVLESPLEEDAAGVAGTETMLGADEGGETMRSDPNDTLDTIAELTALTTPRDAHAA